MAVEYRKATAEEYADLIDFGNMVFKIDFAALLPKLYKDHPELAQCHYLALEDGKIKAMVGSFPLSFTVDGQEVKVYGIGTVSVHPYSRGKGYMKELMKRAVADAKAEGADLMCLGGQRQRYEYFGFAKACQQRSFTLTPTNRRHWKHISTKGVEVLPLSENAEYTVQCWKLHQSQPIHANRPLEQFAEICRSWSCEPFVIRKDGEFLGYVILDEEKGMAAELLLMDWQDVLAVLFALVEKCGKELKIFPFYTQKELIRALCTVAEYGSAEDEEMFQTLNFPRMLELFLGLKGRQTGLLDGSLALEIPGEGKWRVTVEGGAVSVRETEDPADWSLDAVRMQNRVFGIGNLWQYDTPLENSWFPIPLELPNHDMT